LTRGSRACERDLVFWLGNYLQNVMPLHAAINSRHEPVTPLNFPQQR
jgi:hypothetical protein